MADVASETVGWYVWLSELSILPQEYQYIMRVISGFFITLALTPIVPIVALVIYDLILWLWRLAAASWSARSAIRSDVAAQLPKHPPINTTASTG